MRELEIRNAIITGVTLSNADHGVLSSHVMLDYGDSCQGFGGYAMYFPRDDHAPKCPACNGSGHL